MSPPESGSSGAVKHTGPRLQAQALIGAAIVALAAWVGLGPWDQLGAPALVVTLLGGLLLLWVVIDTPRETRRSVLWMVGTALALRIAAAWLFAEWMGPARLFDDAISYDRVGWALAQSWHQGAPIPADLGGLAWVAGEGFTKIVAGIYYALGHSPTSVVMVNCLLGALAVYLTYWLGANLFEEQVGELAGWLAAFYTGIWIFSVMVLKDALVLTVTLLFFYAWYKWLLGSVVRPASWGWIVLTLASAWLLRELRDYVWLFAVVAAALALVLRSLHSQRGRWIAIAVAVLALLLVSPLLVRLSGTPVNWAGFGQNSFLGAHFSGVPTGGTVADLARWAAAHPLVSVELLGLSVVSTLIAPYAWILPGLLPGTSQVSAYTLALPGMWLWYLVLPFALLGAWLSLARAKGRPVPLLLFGAGLFLLFALVIPRESRHRDLVMPIGLILAAEGIIRGWRWKRFVLWVWLPLGIAAVVKLGAYTELLTAVTAVAALMLLSHVLRGRHGRLARAP